jgi:hypothetical protein
MVRNIVGALSEADLDVYWERAAPGTREWKSAARKVSAARCIIIFWSAASAGDDAAAYIRFARRMLRAGKAICVRLGNAAIPQGMEGCTTYDLRGWRADASSLFMLDVVAGAKAKAAGLDPPLPSAPRKLLFKRLAIAVPSAIAAIALVIGLYRDIGIDRFASPEERAAWRALRPGSCADLREFLETYSDGGFASQAQALLSTRSVRTSVDWQESERPLSLYVPAATAAFSASDASARQAARRRAESEGMKNCNRLARAGSSRLKSTSIEIENYACERFSSGTVCAVEGEVICRLAEPFEVAVESCGKH